MTLGSFTTRTGPLGTTSGTSGQIWGRWGENGAPVLQTHGMTDVAPDASARVGGSRGGLPRQRTSGETVEGLGPVDQPQVHPRSGSGDDALARLLVWVLGLVMALGWLALLVVVLRGTG